MPSVRAGEAADFVAGAGAGLEKTMRRRSDGGEDSGEGELQQDGANRSSGDDECGGWLKNLAKFSTFEQQAGGDSSEA